MNIFAILFFCGLVSLSKSLSDPPSVVSADRICKPGPPLKRTPGKTNCLIIGDSVSIGYTPWIAKLLGDGYQVQHAPWDHKDGGALDSKYGRQCLSLFLMTVMMEPTTYDVIIFNFGLHDVNYNGEWPEEYTSPADYAENIGEIKSILISTGAKVGYVLTTPVPYNVSINNLVLQYNDIATNLMNQQPAIPIADLYTWVVEACGDPPYDNCKIAAKQPSPHYSPQGYQYLAQRLIYLVRDLKGKENGRRQDKHSHLNTLHEDTNKFKWMRSAFKDSVACRDKSGQVVTVCPSNSTCCASLFSSSGQGCCLLSQAASCSDGKHCCRAGYGCDPSCSVYQCNCLRNAKNHD